MFSSKLSHELALKRMSRYLKQKEDCGLLLKPNSYMCKVDAYPDADFAGMYGLAELKYPECVNSRTRFIIMFADFPVLWVSKLQAKTSLSTMEAEIIVMDHCCRELFPIIYITTSLVKEVGLNMANKKMNVSFQEDNVYALVLDRTFPPQFTQSSKYYATKNIGFCEDIVKHRIKFLKFDTVEQLGELFTKGMLISTIGYMCKKIIGW